MIVTTVICSMRRRIERDVRSFLCLALVGFCVAGGCTRIDRSSVGVTADKGFTRQSSTIAHTLRIGDTSEVTSLNPHLDTTAALANLAQLTMAYLVRYGADNRPEPELAVVIPTKANGLISQDGKTITWRLRRHVRWSDGALFDADDVVYSTNVALAPQNNEISRDGFDLIIKVDEPDKYTVVYHLRRPYSGFLPTFFGSAGANPCILPKHLLSRYRSINTVDYNSRPIGIGPFRYVDWIHGDRVDLEPNLLYWRGRPKLKRIVYRFIPDRNTLLTQLRTGEIDLWPLVGLGFYSQVNALSNVTTVHAPGYWYSHLDFNEERPVFSEGIVRRALRLSIDRRTLRDKIQHGLGILQEGPVTPVSSLYTPLPPVVFDPLAAGRMLDQAGWRRGADGIRAKNGRRLTFTLATMVGLPDADQEIELIRSDWQQLGAEMTVRHYAPALFFAPRDQGGILYGGKFDATVFAWQLTPDGDLSTTHECNAQPPAGQNIAHYCNGRTDALLEGVKAAYPESERKVLLAAVQRQIVADVPEINLWIREDIFAYNRDVRGWHPNAITPFDSMLGVDL